MLAIPSNYTTASETASDLWREMSDWGNFVMRTRSISEWSGLLRTIGEASAPSGAELHRMLGECARRGLDEAWFLKWRVMGSPDAWGADLTRPPAAKGAQARLWRACAETSAEGPEFLEVLADSHIERGDADRGALLPQGLHRAIEVWTETELSCLHALWHAGDRNGRPDWQQRALAAARWHVSRLQPDNATNRPWAAHLFVLVAARDGCADAALYAETLIHNCQVQSGRPDPLSALILVDSADALDRLDSQYASR